MGKKEAQYSKASKTGSRAQNSQPFEIAAPSTQIYIASSAEEKGSCRQSGKTRGKINADFLFRKFVFMVWP